MGEEAVLADSGRAGEVAAGAGGVRSLAILSILREWSPLGHGGSRLPGVMGRGCFGSSLADSPEMYFLCAVLGPSGVRRSGAPVPSFDAACRDGCRSGAGRSDAAD